MRLRYRLDDDDRTALGTIPTATATDSIRWFEITRLANGTRRLATDAQLRRDRAGREPMLAKIRETAERWWPSNIPEEEYEEIFRPDKDRVERLADALSADDESLSDEIVEDLRELGSELEDEHPELAEDLRQLANFESMTRPYKQSRDTLFGRAPQFVRFNDEARLLESEYDLSVVAENPGAALRNLAALGELNLVALREAIAAGGREPFVISGRRQTPSWPHASRRGSKNRKSE